MGLLTGTAKFVYKHPGVTMGLAGAGVSAAQIPKPGDELEEEIMKNYTGTPGGKYVFAELNAVAARKEYLEKKACSLMKTAGMEPITFGSSLVSGLGQGIGKAVGQAGVDVIRALIGAAGNAMSLGTSSLNAQKKMLLDRVVKGDPMLMVFNKQNPGVLENAYTTMVRTAPHVSEDPNVVVSFLREASQTGGSINYVTMKHLAEAERAFMEARGATRPIF